MTSHRRFVPIVSFFILWLMAACNQEIPMEQQTPSVQRNAFVAPSADESSEDPSLLPQGSLMARTGAMDLKVAEFDKALAEVRTKVAELGGSVTRVSRERESKDVFFGTVTVSVPSDKFFEAMDRFAELGEVYQRKEESEDLTNPTIDVTARLNNARALEKRIMKLLESDSARLPELLEAERELARIRERIEILDIRREKLSRRVKFSTITMSLFVKGSQEMRVRTWWGPFVQQAKDIGHTFATSLGWLLTVTVFLIPWLFALWLTPGLVERLRKRFARKPPKNTVLATKVPKNEKALQKDDE